MQMEFSSKNISSKSFKKPLMKTETLAGLDFLVNSENLWDL